MVIVITPYIFQYVIESLPDFNNQTGICEALKNKTPIIERVINNI